LNFKEFIVGDAFSFRPLVRPEDDAKYKQNPEARAKLSVVFKSLFSAFLNHSHRLRIRQKLKFTVFLEVT